MNQHTTLHVDRATLLRGGIAHINRIGRLLVPALMLLTTLTLAYAQESDGSGEGGERRESEKSRMPGAVLGIGAGFEGGYPIYWPFDDITFDDPSEDNILSSRVTFSFIFPKLFMEGFGLSTKLNFAYYDMMVVESDYGYVETPGGEVYGLVENRKNLTYPAIGMDLSMYGQFGPLARVEFGPYGMLGFMPMYRETTELASGYGHRLPDYEWEKRSERNNEVVFVETGAALSISFEVPLGAGLAILPSATVRAGAVTDSDDADWWVTASAGAGLSLLFGSTRAD